MAILPRVAIVGGGPAGLTLARLLQVYSIPYQLFERDRDRFARRQGGSLDLHQDSAQVVLKEAGIYEEVMKHARPEGEVLKIYNPQNEILLDEGEEGGGRRPAGEFAGRPEIDRRKLRDLLLDSLDQSTISWGRKLRSLRRNDRGKIDLYFTTTAESDASSSKEGKEKQEGFDLVVGADGAWSKVREALTDQKPIYSGVGGLDLTLSEIDNRHPELAKSVGPGMCLTLGESRGLMAQRNGDGSVRCYAFVRRPEEEYNHFASEPGQAVSDPESVKRGMLEKFYANWHEIPQSLVLHADPTIYVRPMYMLPIGLTWDHQSGITAVGDAAHLMTPFAGVGVNVAMEDALQISREILAAQEAGEWTSGSNLRKSIAKAIRGYEQAMWKRAEQNAHTTWIYLELFFNPRGGHAMIEHFEQEKAKEVAEEIRTRESKRGF